MEGKEKEVITAWYNTKIQLFQRIYQMQMRLQIREIRVFLFF